MFDPFFVALVGSGGCLENTTLPKLRHGANNLQPRSEGCYEDVAATGAEAHGGGPNTRPPTEASVPRGWPVTRCKVRV